MEFATCNTPIASTIDYLPLFKSMSLVGLLANSVNRCFRFTPALLKASCVTLDYQAMFQYPFVHFVS
jgi:hypothetical protein